MNIVRKLAIVQPKINTAKYLTGLSLVNFYSKNTKTHRKKQPHEAKAQGKWLGKNKGQLIVEETTDKLVAQRQIVDPVWLMNEYKIQNFNIEDAINFHKELARPDMLNNIEGYLSVRFLLDMTTKKKTKFMDNFKGTIYYPHFFADGFKKEIVAICKNDAEIEAARNAGALFAGYTDILKKFEKGEISDQSYDFLVCTPETFEDVMLLKKKINKDKLPSVKTNTVTENIAQMVEQLHLSKDYETAKTSDEQAVLKTKIGPLNFETNQLVENLAAIIEKIKTHKKYAADSFIASCVLFAPPSTEKFRVDISRFSEAETKENEEKESVAQ
ncbi:39S ribosomal mitochondrial [Brachionus plicatilis]|uniref:39S ribosomal mitochondrial n=1 Tax=Brachionus plicatilis TaxID=10195 RepID=A0A3M7SC56_BRAPC|nr:39S ribosomal mitochondrial [Brachionus plicatilis]